MDALRDAVERGVVKVERKARGWLVTGAVNSPLILADLIGMGGVWKRKAAGYYVESADLTELAERTREVAKASAARAAAASAAAAKALDAQRAKMQREVRRELQDAYLRAMAEHKAEFDALKALQEAAPYETDPAEYMKRLNRMKELESVYDALADGLANAGAAARTIADGKLPKARAISRNIAAWQLDNMAGVRVARFVGHDVAGIAATGRATYHDRFDLKAWDGVEDRAACRAAIKKTVTRSLLTGENPEKVAARLEGLFTGDTPLSPYKRALRIAQTETASIMNEGILETIREANAKGVKVRKRWDATLDGRTRDDHRRVDGEVVDVDETFSNGLLRPGKGGPADRINCRCCLTEVLEGFEPDAPVRLDGETGQKIPYMSYSEWERTYGGVTN